MSYADTLLAKDETIVYRARQFWLAPVSDARNPLLLLLLGIVLALVERQVLNWGLRSIAGLVDLILILVALVWIGIVYLTWRAEEYIITSRRVLKVEGLLDKKSGDSSLDKINDAVLKQGLLARMLHYGDLEVLTANEEGIDKYQMLANVVEFKKAMLNAKNYLDDGFRGQARTGAAPAAPAAPMPAASADDPTATLAKLADLRDKGAITPAEYEAKKAELLGRM
ncbi:MAG TPA: PH domain-containing protein [Candidatus Limnocylindrales bacterium]|nr:PH domain-containing protein [Candidatus Limnocylindrales bacterium]